VWYVLSCLLCAEFCVAQICRTRWKKILLEPFLGEEGAAAAGVLVVVIEKKKK
jgi:hypothetical protein